MRRAGDYLDRAIDFATLGEFGFETPDAGEARKQLTEIADGIPAAEQAVETLSDSQVIERWRSLAADVVGLESSQSDIPPADYIERVEGHDRLPMSTVLGASLLGLLCCAAIGRFVVGVIL